MGLMIVVKDLTGVTIPGATGTLSFTGAGSPKVVSSAQDGSIDFGGYDPTGMTNFGLKVEKPGYSSAEFQADVVDGNLYPQTVFLQDLSTVPMVCKVKVVDQGNMGKPGVTVRLKPSIGPGEEVVVVTDGQGEAAFTVTMGVYKITVEQVGWETFGCLAKMLVGSGIAGRSTTFLPMLFKMKQLPVSGGGAP